MSLCLLFFIIGCEKEEIGSPLSGSVNLQQDENFVPENLDVLITKENFRSFIKPKKKVVIEYTTPEEMNEFFRKNNLPLLPDDIVRKYYALEKSGSLRSQFDDECHTANLIAELGDFSGNGTLSTLDVALADLIVGSWSTDYEVCDIQNASAVEELTVAMMQHISPDYADPDDGFTLNDDDPEAIRDVLLGFTCCDQ